MPTHFFSCDWGTTSFRLRLCAESGRRVLAEVREEAGVKSMQGPANEPWDRTQRAAAFAAFLRDQLTRLARAQGIAAGTTPTVVSGMASSTVGWHELPYARAPLALDGRGLVVERIPPAEMGGEVGPVWLVSGVRTETDIMRGEECEILGLVAGARRPEVDGGAVMILPGTHSKHAWVRDGALVDFRTSMTGELGDVLARHSLLRMSVRWPLEGGIVDDALRNAFLEGVHLAAREGLSQALFRVRTRTVLGGVSVEQNGWFLSGLLIGAEVVGLLDTADLPGRPILLAGSAVFSGVYEAALRALGAGDRLVVLPADEVANATVWAHARVLERRERETEEHS